MVALLLLRDEAPCACAIELLAAGQAASEVARALRIKRGALARWMRDRAYRYEFAAAVSVSEFPFRARRAFVREQVLNDLKRMLHSRTFALIKAAILGLLYLNGRDPEPSPAKRRQRQR